ncbi:hypothetical protein GCM10010234_10520 [Streptomyces hawaiiensis]
MIGGSGAPSILLALFGFRIETFEASAAESPQVDRLRGTDARTVDMFGPPPTIPDTTSFGMACEISNPEDVMPVTVAALTAHGTRPAEEAVPGRRRVRHRGRNTAGPVDLQRAGPPEMEPRVNRGSGRGVSR